ncbi:Bug family tripartite tricarboxylate transporter substrate binding protein [Falsiroseomonas stagni]|uniref:Tripartite-type tricarboxylate transporter, receptor component TctC n=1 Tax=Falsiroseomonas stagni DSM 19981 TaxID=1123062 RepID=A0A1I4D640_9PROT|nr:tripartite tricarboxylate transporter substrate binding protein [Falsiroseomonas stagni]SFK88595.1 Tripartite-type tricarboxylate transporter, receptor component TctC [Falsiroseomonas stagni DSM 19981]
MATRRTALATLLATLASPALAQDAWPTRPIRVIVPFTPGGGTDVMMRLVAQGLSNRFGQQVVVDNVAGAGGTIGAMQVVNAQPDGHTLLCGTPGSIAVNPVMQAGIRYHPLRDLAPVAQLTDSPIVLVANKDFPVDSVAALIALAKAQPGVINFGSAGPGSVAHLSGEMFCALAGVQITHVPYRGTSQSLLDLRAGRIQLLFENLPPVMEAIALGHVKAIAVGTPQRSDLLPQLPTIAEAGVPGYVSSSYMGLLAPARTPPEIVRRLAEACAAVVQDADLAARLRGLGATPTPTTPDAFRGFIGERIADVTKLVEATGLSFN